MPSSTDATLRGGVPLRYANRTFDAYQPSTPSQRTALGRAQYLAERRIRSLVLIGPVGVGKSHLAAAAMRAMTEIDAAEHVSTIDSWREAVKAEEAAERAKWDGALPQAWRPSLSRPGLPERPQWVNVPALLTDLRTEIGLDREDQRAARWVRDLRETRGLVVLDDLGREKISDWTGELVYTLVNARYESLLPTLATSNLTADQLHESGYWPAISRLAEDGALVAISGPDHRIRSAA